MPKMCTLKELIETEFRDAEIILEGLVSKQELILAIAPSKSCKSFFAMNSAIAVATGEVFLETFNCKKGKVLYLQTEISDRALKERFLLLLKDFRMDSGHMENIFIFDDRIKIDTEGGREFLKSIIRKQNIDFVILDPFYTLHHSDENSASEMSAILTGLKDVIRECNVGCLLIHHEGKYYEGKSTHISHRGRGSSAIGDVPDGHLYLKRETQNDFSVEGNFRNSAALSMRLEMNQNMKFSVSKKQKIQKPDVDEQIMKALGKEIRSKADLLDSLNKEFGFSYSTLEKAVSRLMKSGSIDVKRQGKEATYSIPEPHHISVLKDRNDDDESGSEQV